MNIRLADRIWQACLSSLQLDRYLMGELSEPGPAQVRAHLASCAQCNAVALGRKAAQAQPLPALRLVAEAAVIPRVVPTAASASRPRRVSWSRAAAGLAALAAAASLFIVFRPAAAPEGSAEQAAERLGERSKGRGYQLSMYVQHGAEVRRAGPGDQIAAGDAVRFAVTTPSQAWVAVLSRDPRGHGSIYFPLGPRAELVPAGADVPLRLGTLLDATVGEELLAALFCSGPVELEPVRASLESGRTVIPKGCEVSQWSFVKR